jgi:myo-inositol-1(or 4)-monophosphatase
LTSFSRVEVEKIESFVKDAGEYLVSLYEKDLVILSEIGSDIKLEADQHLEKKIVAFLDTEFDYPILGEEFGATEDFSNLTGFIVDPIDGTMNFSRGNPTFCISIGFFLKGEPILGIVYNPILKELFTGIVGNGFYFNGRKINLENKVFDLNKAILATGIPTKLNKDQKTLSRYLDKVRFFKKVRMIGSAAQSLAWIGLGRFDMYVEDSIMIWDVAAGLAIIKAIGGEYDLVPLETNRWEFNVIASVNPQLMNSYRITNL